jgi:hypothetical protein
MKASELKETAGGKGLQVRDSSRRQRPSYRHPRQHGHKELGTGLVNKIPKDLGFK